MGTLLIYIAFFSALIASASFFSAHFGKTKNIRFGRFFFHVAAVATISSAAFLLYLIISHQFQYTYVWNYSSRDLPVNLLISTFYAGQEGSFHLWAVLMAILGIFLLAYVSQKDGNKDRYEAQVMAVFTLLQTFLLFILIIKSPYLKVWESFPKDVELGFIPPDGRGLNPLLQNFWMTIHPPILFTGFTSLSIPFSFAMAALMRNEYDRWIKIAMPWALFSGMILGLGIMLGGYWAYGVLGWGGYWGWDPVENSSLVPWVIIVAAIHTMVSGLTTGKFKKTTLLLCILAYVMVLYSTFLTRSGILGDASVHSFVDPGQEVYLFLVVFLSLFGGGGIVLLISRLKHLKTVKSETPDILSKESALFIGTITLCAAALVIAIGTSWPIFAKGTVDPSFYNKMNLPLAILIAAINGFSILLKWKHSEEKQFIRSLYVPVGLTAAVTIVMVFFGMNDVLIAIFAAASFFALFINAESAYRIIVNSASRTGAYIAHLGIMILFLGVIGSAKYSQEVNVSLPIGEPREALGYTLTYLKATEIPGEHDKYHFNVAVQKEDGSAYLLQPVMYYSEYSQGVMKNPDYAPLATKDIYIAPMALEVPDKFDKEDLVSISKGETKEAKGISVKFVEVTASPMMGNHDHEGEMGDKVAVKLEVTANGKTEFVTAEQKVAEGNQEPVPVQLAGSDRYTFYLSSMSVEGETKINLAVVDETLPKKIQPAETLVVTAAVKPFISFVWIGTLVMVIGFFLSVLNRYRKVKRESLKLSNVSVNGHTDVHKKHVVKQKA